MPVRSNSVRMAVRPTLPYPGAGWQVRVRDSSDFTTELAVINEFVELSAGPQLNDVGQGSVTFDADHPFWSTVLANGESAHTLLEFEHLWEAWEDGVLRFQWLGSAIEEHYIEEDETRAVTVSGNGTAQVLAWAAILTQNFPSPAPEPPPYSSQPRGQWEFPPDFAAMTMWYTVMQAAQKRKTIPWVKPLFTSTQDALGGEGSVWEYVPTIQTSADTITVDGITAPRLGFAPELGTNLLDFLNTCTGQDDNQHFAMRAEWFMWPNFQLEVKKIINAESGVVAGIGSHVEDKVIFYEAGTAECSRTRARDNIATSIIVWAKDSGDFSSAEDSVMVSKWGRREYFESSYSNLTDATRRDAAAKIILEQRKDEVSEWTIQVPYGLPGRRPFVDFDIGDWVGVGRLDPVTHASKVEAFRVMAMVVNIADDASTVELTLQSVLDVQVHQLARQLNSLINKIDQGNPFNDTFPGTGPTYPAPLYLNPNGSISPVTTDTSGTALGPVRVFIQDTDPGDQARPGDFWYDTGYPNDEVEPDPIPDPDVENPRKAPAAPYQDFIDAGRGEYRIPGNKYGTKLS